jgi:hypothetical protein
MHFWANLLGYQAAWFIAVGFAGRGLAWPGIVACLGFAALSWWVSPVRRSDAWLAAAALACGLLLDGALAATGWLAYAAAQPAFPAPAWIVSLWVAFALTLQHSLRWVMARPALAIAFGAIGGPLAYWGAARAFDAVAFGAPLHAAATLAIGWALAMAVLLAVARRTAVPISLPAKVTA